jgi:beta-galactosidase
MRAARIGIEWARIFPKPTTEVKTQVKESREDVTRVAVEDKDLKKLNDLANKDALDRYRAILSDWKSRGG